MDVTITGLYHYPVKSLRGIGLAQCSLTRKGVFGDREWVVIDENGAFLSQRKLPRMALIRVRRREHGLELSLGSDSCLASTPANDASIREVSVWKDKAVGILAADSINKWLTRVLESEKPLFLASFDKSRERLPGQPLRFGADATHFADAAPFLIANAFSLHALNLSLTLQDKPEVDIRHFRPNIVISGLPGFAEHHIRGLRHRATDIEFSLVDPCQRCSIITLDPDSAEQMPEAIPFKQLTSLNPMPGNKKAPAFGMNACILDTDDIEALQEGLRLGDRLEVIQ
ncbi:MOSC domain-containing protein [Teredinibacter franksiae]|uniref:MOSC domain-containing protein n=1 Tax=Teredinibacter franksiae TaxID=2761453 RepID=UPI00162746AA|nr:MOSC N-terminal beta barrel domain-containing protein [Teredinibacter franksiae]